MIWFGRVLLAFIRRELSALGGYRIAFVIRLFGLGLAVGSMVFLSRFVGAAANPHLAGYGGNYLGFMALGVITAEFQHNPELLVLIPRRFPKRTAMAGDPA